jgi:hypothetical protein
VERIKADFDKAVEAFEKRNPETPKKFFYGGFVEQPELGPTAHGSEALASRTRLAAPGSTSTTSTGLNYLLAEDNDNQRVPFGQKVKDVRFITKKSIFKNDRSCRSRRCEIWMHLVYWWCYLNQDY